MWSGLLHDGRTLILLLREHLRTGEMGFEGAGEGLFGEARGEGVA